MRQMLLGGVIAASLLAPVSGYAQSAPASRDTSDAVATFRPDQWVVLGAGAVVGALAFEMVMTTDVAAVAGAVVGGYLSYLYYNGRNLELRASPRT